MLRQAQHERIRRVSSTKSYRIGNIQGTPAIVSPHACISSNSNNRMRSCKIITMGLQRLQPPIAACSGDPAAQNERPTMRNLETAATFAATLVAQALVIATIFVA